MPMEKMAKTAYIILVDLMVLLFATAAASNRMQSDAEGIVVAAEGAVVETTTEAPLTAVEPELMAAMAIVHPSALPVAPIDTNSMENVAAAKARVHSHAHKSIAASPSGAKASAVSTSVATPSPIGGGVCVYIAPGWYSYVYKKPCMPTSTSNCYRNQGYKNCATGTKEAATYVQLVRDQAFVYTGSDLVECTNGYYWAEIKFGTSTAWVPAFKIVDDEQTDFIYLCDDEVDSQGHAIVRHAQYMLGNIYSWGAQSIWGPVYGTNKYGCDKYCCGGNRYGFDCAGLTRFAVYSATDIDISGGTEVQIATTKCTVVWGSWTSGSDTGNWGKGDVPLPGDLIFYGSPTTHVAIYVGWVTGHGDMMVESKQTGWYVGQSPVRWTPRTKVIRCWE